ncbi:MAG: hypothetical protein EOM05_11790 [Clostridia bacterium]|nr:hypothetical protein [Clostridia bacterium]
MKTAEENAFDDKIDQVELEELMYDEFYKLIAEAKNIGYKKAMRWRDPKEELPKNVGLYLCKCKKQLGFYFDIVFFNKVWRSDNVIGWRPIE